MILTYPEIRKFLYTIVVGLLSPMVGTAHVIEDEAAVTELQHITVHGQRVANNEPASAAATLATMLRYDPRVDLQARGLPEGQADITIRGGLFENTGLTVGAVTVFDPQTGHYTSLLPLAPHALSEPRVLTGVNNALLGFNAAVATVQYDWQRLRARREIGLGFGSDALRYQSLALGHVFDTNNGEGGLEITYAGSDGEGSLANGDHDFEQVFARAQHRSGDRQTDLALSYQDNFYAWPGAYTGFASLPETDHTKTTSLILNQRFGDGVAGNDSHYIEWGAYYRELVDDYDFDRTTSESAIPGAFDHKTRSVAAGLKGRRAIGAWQWQYGLQLTADELLRSTDLTHGDFDSRRYARLSVVPTRRWSIGSQTQILWRIGATLDASNRDSNVLLPLTGVSWLREHAAGSDRLSLELSSASQLPGYTALNSAENGLFGGNATLGRERAQTLSLSLESQREQWQANVAVFVRRDDDLVDWTFLRGAPFARQANAVDIDVVGVETLLRRHFSAVELVAGYSYLSKDADYGTSLVDASFYALNYARHRLTLALWVRPSDRLLLRWDNELREQADNPLRTTDRKAYTTSLALEWSPEFAEGLKASLIADNLTNSNFEEFPGTPTMRRQLSIKLRYAW